MIYSYETERHFLAGILKYPNQFSEVASFITDDDFFCGASQINITLFRVIRAALQNGEFIDPVIISERVKSYGLTFDDDINVADYIESLYHTKINEESIVQVSKELKKFTIRRQIFNACSEVAKKMKSIPSSSSYDDIIRTADSIYNKQIDIYESGLDVPVNIFEKMEAFIEERGNNPITEFGMMGPHPKINEIYGSLVRPGNITVIVARSAVGKTSFVMDYAIRTAAKYDVPVLHFDNGEMSEEELIVRECAALSGVPFYLLETGQWRKAGPEIVKKVRDVWPKVKNLKFYYFGVGGQTVDQMITSIKRFYYSKVGRGKEMIFSFDYIKTSSESRGANYQEHQIVGEMVDKFKRCIQKELKFDGKPTVGMLTSVQANRIGISNNRNSTDLVEDESIISLSDRIIHFASHVFFLRQKTLDELQAYKGFGTHNLICFKFRHLGRDIAGALQPVKFPDGSIKRNFINLEFSNFGIEEKGDLRDIVKSLGPNLVPAVGEPGEDAPEMVIDGRDQEEKNEEGHRKDA